MRSLLLTLLLVPLFLGQIAPAQAEPACERRERLTDPLGQTRCLAEFPVLAEPHGRSRGWVPAHGIYSLAISPPNCPAVAGAGSNNNSPLHAFSSQRDALALDACERGLRARQAAADCRCQILVRDGDFQVDAEGFQALLRLAPAAPSVSAAAPEPAPRQPPSTETAIQPPPTRELEVRHSARPQPPAAIEPPRKTEVARPDLQELPRLPQLLAAHDPTDAAPVRLRSDALNAPKASAATPLSPSVRPLPAAALPRLAPRRALVIGNRDYLVGPLRNPLNDARAIAAELRRLGFEVQAVENLRRDDIGPTLDRFVDSVRAGDDLVVFYAGHGLQLKGVNYLPAVDARIRSETDVPLNSINLSHLLERLDESKAGVRLLLIDACRDNPYAKAWRSGSRGLARVSGAPAGTLLHFATRPGGVAADGDGPNGLYTTHLLRHLGRRGEPVELVLKAVSAAVRQASDGAQQPWMEGSLEGDFYFAPAGPPD